jgi:hypothetical protein
VVYKLIKGGKQEAVLIKIIFKFSPKWYNFKTGSAQRHTWWKWKWRG